MKLSDIQVGQRVVISPMFNSHPYEFGNVTRITKTRIYSVRNWDNPLNTWVYNLDTGKLVRVDKK